MKLMQNNEHFFLVQLEILINMFKLFVWSSQVMASDE